MNIYLGTEIDDKLAGNLELGKTIVLTGWNSDFTLSIGLLVTISNGDTVASIFTAAIGGGFADVEIDDKLAGTWALGNTGSFCS